MAAARAASVRLSARMRVEEVEMPDGRVALIVQVQGLGGLLNAGYVVDRCGVARV